MLRTDRKSEKRALRSEFFRGKRPKCEMKPIRRVLATIRAIIIIEKKIESVRRKTGLNTIRTPRRRCRLRNLSRISEQHWRSKTVNHSHRKRVKLAASELVSRRNEKKLVACLLFSYPRLLRDLRMFLALFEEAAAPENVREFEIYESRLEIIIWEKHEVFPFPAF